MPQRGDTMAGDFLKRSRHGTTFFFRRRVPQNICAILGKNVIVKSLGTEKRREAVILARSLAVQTDAIFYRLRTMSKNSKVEYSFSFDLNELRLTVTDAKPEDQAAIDSHIATTLQNLPVGVEVPVRPLPETRPQRSSSNKTILQVWEEYKAVMLAKGAQTDIKGGWKSPGRVNVEQFVHVKAFVEHVGGDKLIAGITDEDVASFRTNVMTSTEIRSAGSRKTRLNRSGALFRYAKGERIIPDDFSELFKFTGDIKKNKFQKFSLDDLKNLFESAAYQNHEFETPSQYWLPLLGLFTGARLNELCQLLKSDVGEREGVVVISILDEESNKRLKTDAARRFVPIHSKLIELGFLDFVKSCPEGRIFFLLREDPLKPGDYPTACY